MEEVQRKSGECRLDSFVEGVDGVARVRRRRLDTYIPVNSFDLEL